MKNNYLDNVITYLVHIYKKKSNNKKHSIQKMLFKFVINYNNIFYT